MLSLHVGDRVAIFSKVSASASSSNPAVLDVESVNHLIYLRATNPGTANLMVSYVDGSSQSVSITVS